MRCSSATCRSTYTRRATAASKWRSCRPDRHPRISCAPRSRITISTASRIFSRSSRRRHDCHPERERGAWTEGRREDRGSCGAPPSRFLAYARNHNAMKFDLVFFDVDSTLVTIEGIDVLALGNPEVTTLTEAAMNGEVPLDQVYAARLKMIKPSRADVDSLAQKYLASLTPGAKETIDALRNNGVSVHLVTAGIAQAMAPLASHLGVRHVHAVSMKFDDAGNYADFDRRSFLTRRDGKELVVRDVRAR